MILQQFMNGLRRPGELRRSIKGLSAKVMYERIKLLEENEIIERELVTEKPLEVHYRLTPKGSQFCEIIELIENLD